MNTASPPEARGPLGIAPFRRRRDLAARTTRAGRPRRSTLPWSACRSISAPTTAPARAAARPRCARPRARSASCIRRAASRRSTCARSPMSAMWRSMRWTSPASLDAIEAFFRDLHALGTTPITIGGDHTVPLPILRAIAQGAAGRARAVRRASRYAGHADGHPHQPCDHVPPRRRGRPASIRGARCRSACAAASSAPTMRPGDARPACASSPWTSSRQLGRARVIEEIGRVIGDGPTYVSFDIDGLDAANAMGTGVPEVGGYRCATHR